MNKTRRIPLRRLAVASLLVAGPLSGCGGLDPGHAPPAPKTANASVTYAFTANAPKCTGSLTWAYKLVQASGSDGSTEWHHDASGDVTAQDNKCTYTDSASGLRPGSWNIGLTGSANALLFSCAGVPLKVGTTTQLNVDENGSCKVS